MKKYKTAVIAGDGIGPEVIAAGLDVLSALADRLGTFAIETERFPWGADYYLAHGRMMPDGGHRAGYRGSRRYGNHGGSNGGGD